MRRLLALLLSSALFLGASPALAEEYAAAEPADAPEVAAETVLDEQADPIDLELEDGAAESPVEVDQEIESAEDDREIDPSEVDVDLADEASDNPSGDPSAPVVQDDQPAEADEEQLPSGWFADGDSRYYRDPETGELLCSGVYEVDGESYCFDPEGRIVTGWVALDGEVYYFDAGSGAMVKDCEQLVEGLCAPIAAADGSEFSDVAESTPHSEDISWSLESGISTGWVSADGTRTFKPMNTVVRQDMAAFLYRLAGSPTFLPTDEDASAFTDVSAATPHALEIWWLAKSGISEGWRETDGTFTFRPMNRVVRQDMAAFLYRLAGAPEYVPSDEMVELFTDVTADTPHANEVWWLAETGVSEGWYEDDGSRTFRPTSSIVRQDVAAFLHRMISTGELEPSATHAYRFDDEGKLLTGWVEDGVFYDRATGARIDEGWIRDGSFLGYLDANAGGLLKDGLHEIAGFKYLFDATGNARRGWIQRNGSKQYFDASSGCQYAGGPFKVSGALYLFDDDGALCYGWSELHGDTYYSDPSTGKLFTGGMRIIDRTACYADAQGRITKLRFGQDLSNASALQKKVAALAWAEPTTPSGWCALWIHNIFDRLGNNEVYGNACDLYDNYCTSSNPADLKVGMIVAVSRHPGTPGGRIYGHIGIYVGNGVMLDSSGTVRTWYVGDWADAYDGWVPAKWGWYGGKSLA